jgi:transposase
MSRRMDHIDMRKLAPAAQEERRRQVIGLRQRGMTYQAIADQIGLSRTGVFNICRRFAQQGPSGLTSKPHGPEPGYGRVLSARQEAAMRKLIGTRTPDQLGLPFALWSRAAVRALIAQRCGVPLAIRTTGTYPARWGFTAQKPLRRAYEQRPKDVQRWLRQDYPAIVARAKRERAVIYWGDETGLRSDDVRGRSFAPRGRTPTIRVCRKRAGLSLISAVTNRGEVRWMILDGALTAPRLIGFLQRLIRDASRKVFLILDNLPAHRAKLVRAWLAAHGDRIEVFYLPSYSPELNPDECLNADLKRAVGSQAPVRSKPDLKRAAMRHMRKLSKSPKRVRSYFQHAPVRYAA